MQAPRAGNGSAAGTVELSWFELDTDIGAADLELLPADERWRATEIVEPQARRRFVRARACLRRTLARRLDIAPHALALDYGAHGKPAVIGHPGLHFNLSHSGGRAVLAVTSLGEVGIDLEQPREQSQLLAVARRFLSAAECERVLDADPAARERVFLRYWTRKEAVLKATGRGMGVDTRAIAVGLDACAPRLSVDFDPRSLRLRDLALDGDWVGAVCIAFPPGACRDFEVVPAAAMLRSGVAA